jgi:hypothetical protein
MLKSTLQTLVASIALGFAVAAPANIPNDPVYFDGGQYSASLLQGAHLWRLQPLAGDDVDVIDRTCVNRSPVPRGIWLVSRDADGRAELIAPSSTQLPTGYPDQIALRACGEKTDTTMLAVPPVVLDWILANVNSVLIDD